MPPENSETEATLLRQIAGQDQLAFGELYDRTSGLVYSVAHRIMGQTVEAEDVTQEIFLAIWNNAGSFDPTLSKPTTWIVALTRNKCIDRLRRLHRRSRVIDESAEFDADGASTDGAERGDEDNATLRTELRSALAALPHDERRLLDLAFFGGLTQREVAVELGLPLGTVKARIRRGLLRLRPALQKLQLETA
jgi:RNA polymerase sigma-70 factor (ECF subfamily)